MNEQEMILLNNYMQENLENANKDVLKLAKKLDIIVKQILLNQNFQKEIQDLNKQIEEL